MIATEVDRFEMRLRYPQRGNLRFRRSPREAERTRQHTLDQARRIARGRPQQR